MAGLRCPACNSDLVEDPVLYRAPSQIYESGATCARCYLASDNPESGIVVSGVCAEHRDPEKRCARLFKAARVLLRDRKADEDEIFPTLSLAAAMGVRRFELLHPRVEMSPGQGTPTREGHLPRYSGRRFGFG